MKTVTGNRLTDGAVVYLADNDQWTAHLNCAARFNDDDALPVLAAAQMRTGEITDAYLITVDEDGAPAGRERFRETIRNSGPTVRAELSRQTGAV